METTFDLIPTFSLTPHRLSIFKTKVKLINDHVFEKHALSKTKKIEALKNIYVDGYETEKRFHNFKISENGRKRMLLKINWLYFMSKSRHKKSITGKEIYNFRINFLTLTLPSKQKHPTSVITNTCFNQFMTEIREKYEMQNFVWRLEFQKNGNVHYHIVTDTFTDFHIVQKIWNRCTEKLGYVAEYTKKHALMSLNDYVKEYNDGGKVDFEVLKKRYLKGRSLHWKVPNSVDVKSVAGQKKIAFYISKYFSKKGNKEGECNEYDNMENSLGLRLWFCSRSLSKLDKITDFIPAFSVDLLYCITSAKDCFEVVHEYCTSYFYSFSSLLAEAKGVIHKVLYTYASKKGYKPCIT